ncbi:hypothetical protein [Georgenia sp. Marseille-Q6866]
MSSVDVAIAPADEFPVNLVFVAGEDDPIWDRLAGVAVVDGPQFGSGDFIVEKGSVVDGGVIGNLTFSLDAGSTGVAFEEIELFVSDLEEPIVVDVGAWSIEPNDADGAGVTATGDFPLTADICGPFSATFRNDTAETITAATATVDAPGASVSTAPIPAAVAPGDEFTLDLELACDASAEFYIVSPTVTYETAQGQHASRLDPMTIGLTAISADTVERIVARSAR